MLREDYLCPGPLFCVLPRSPFQTYLLRGGEEMVIILLSIMWQVGVTILKAKTLHNIKFRHQQRISNSDILLVHCSGQHYVAAGELVLFPINPVQCIYFALQLVEVVDQSVQMVLRLYYWHLGL